MITRYLVWIFLFVSCSKTVEPEMVYTLVGTFEVTGDIRGILEITKQPVLEGRLTLDGESGNIQGTIIDSEIEIKYLSLLSGGSVHTFYADYNGEKDFSGDWVQVNFQHRLLDNGVFYAKRLGMP